MSVMGVNTCNPAVTGLPSIPYFGWRVLAHTHDKPRMKKLGSSPFIRRELFS